jgi:hypothetical protein
MEYDDLATLSSIDPGVVMQTLKDRHAGDKIYTKNGAVLVAINPYKSIEVYGDAELKQYKESMALETEPPHIFAVSAATHRSLISEGKNQAVVISGESGAGKTESARFVLQYLRFVSNATEDLETRIHTSQPLTEAFGCAKTVRNDNRCALLRAAWRRHETRRVWRSRHGFAGAYFCRAGRACARAGWRAAWTRRHPPDARISIITHLARVCLSPSLPRRA